MANLYQLRCPGAVVLPWLVEDERLDQFIQQSPYVVVLLRRAGYGLVAHGADTAHLQPLYQTSLKNKKDRRDMKREVTLCLKTDKIHSSRLGASTKETPLRVTLLFICNTCIYILSQ